ncbi:CKLF-like MARVEL transmembrane domain-containing protein 6 [Menidia menidia]
MASEGVYNPTTAPASKDSCFRVPSELLDMPRFILKLLQVVLSFLAFVLEELVSSCLSCHPLYFFEFVSCTAFLFTLLLLVLLSTALHAKVGVAYWPPADVFQPVPDIFPPVSDIFSSFLQDFCYTAVVCLFLFISSIVFFALNGGTGLEQGAAVFGLLAAFAFGADLVYSLKTRGSPFKNGGRAPLANGVPAPGAPPETEKLNAVVNGD